MAKNNPNGANQWFSDPRQELFLKEYLNPQSPLWGNALQSALKAGYSQEYSESITSLMPDWLSERLGKSKLVQKAEKNLEMALDGVLDDPEKGAKVIQWKATEMALKTQGKELGYTERTELTGKDGKDLKISFDPIFEK
jgi:hypothetical protein